MADSQLDFKQAMADFKAMFPHIGTDVIEKVLRQNNGVVDATIDHLLALTVADTETDTNEYATIPSLTGSSSQSQFPSASNRSAPARSSVQSVPRPVQAEPQRPQQQQQNGPAVGRLIDLDDEISTPNPGPVQPSNAFTPLTPWDNAPRSQPSSTYYNHTSPRSQPSSAYYNQASNSNPNVQYDSPATNAHPRSTNVGGTPRNQRQSQHASNEYNSNEYSEVSNSGLVLESNAFRSQPQRSATTAMTSAAQRSAGRDATERYYEEVEPRRHPAPNTQPQAHLPHRSISMVETDRPRRPDSTGTRQAAGLNTSRQNDVNTESQRERRSSHNEPAAGQISAEMLQEKLAENQFRRRSLMERSSSLRQPASFASGASASASANARRSNPNTFDMHLDELDELSNEEQILSDEYLAIMLQNEEFVTSLRNDHEFMDELQRDALIGERDIELQNRRSDDSERDRARFEHRKSTIERAQRNRESIVQPRTDDGLQRSDTSNRASISMFGSRRAVEPETSPSVNLNASANAGRTLDSRWANTSSARTTTTNGGSQQRSAGGNETGEADTNAGYGEDRVPDLEAFPFSRTIPPDETADIQKQLKNMRGSTRKKFVVLAKKFFSKSYRKKFTEVNQRFYKQVTSIGSEPTFGLLDEDDAEYATLQQAALASKQQPQSTDSSSHNVEHDADADADTNTDERPIRRYNLDRY